MKEYLTLAWRNIWRNKRRTLITMASIFFAMFFALVMRSFQLGSYDHMVDNAVKAYTGHIQIHENGYWDKKEINHTFEFTEEITDQINSISNVELAVPRLESFALVSSGPKTKGILLVGVDPEKENTLTHLADKVVTGEYFHDFPDRGILVSKRLSKFLNITVGDSLILISQGYHGASATDIFQVKGIVYFRSPLLDNKLIYMDLQSCQEFYSASNRLTSLVINLKNHHLLKKSSVEIKNKIDMNTYEVMTWKEMEKELVQQIQSDNAGGLIMLGILYLIIGFGIFGTVLMMTAERKREFGVMVAVGMRKMKLGMIVAVEMIFIGIIGIITGILGSLPIIYLGYQFPIRLGGEMADAMENFGIEPVMPCAWQLDYFYNQSLIIVIIIFIAILYPIYSITKIDVIKALKS